MGVNRGQGFGDDTVSPKGKANAKAAGDAVTPKTENSSGVVISKDSKPAKSSESHKNVPKRLVFGYDEMILEALSSIKHHNGSDFGAIIAYIEIKYDVPQNFRRLLSSKLREFVLQGTLEKVQKRNKIKCITMSSKTPLSIQKDVRKRLLQESMLTISVETVENAAKTAAYKIAEAEHKSLVAAEADEEFERVSQMAEDADAVLMHLKQILQQ